MKNHPRRTLAWLLCVAMAATLALPALADEETGSASSAVEAPAKVETPAAKEEAPAKVETPAAKEETPAKAETPAAKEEAPAKVETPAAATAPSATPAAKEETPAKSEAPAAATAPSEVPAASAAVSPSAAPSASARPSASTAPSASARPSASAAPSTSARPSASAAPSASARPSASAAPSASARPSASAAASVAPSATPRVAPTAAPAADDDDGFTVDWDEVGTLKGGDWQVAQWGIARGDGGYWVYLENDQPQVSIGITYYHNASDAIRYRAWMSDGASLLGENELPIKDSELTVIREGNSCRMEGFIPDSFFKENRFILSSGNVTLFSEDIPLLEGAAPLDVSDDVYNESHKEVDPDTKAQAIGAAYTGITIDGDFSDWDAVPRYPLKDEIDVWGNVKNYDTVDSVSVVWDGDYVYILLVADGDQYGAGNWNSVCGAGPNNNGQYAIVTDLNQQLLVQPMDKNGTPVVNGIDDAQVAVNNKEWFGAPHMWEIAIPAEHLPKYLENFDFGLYLVEPAISGITDLQGGADEDKSFNGVVIDGKFADWTYYPMTTIQYATPGTQDVVRDAHGALWADNNILYGYVASNMVAHLGARGGEFLADISLAFNGDRSHKEYPTDGNFYPRIVSFDSGSPIVLNEGTRLEDGDYTFYIFDVRTAPEAPLYDAETNTTQYFTNADLKENAFGVIKVHVDGVLDQAEFELDLDKVAAYIQKDGDTAFKTIEIQWGRLGQQWISYAGTPTGPIISVALLVGAVGIPMGYAEYKKRRRARTEGEAK